MGFSTLKTLRQLTTGKEHKRLRELGWTVLRFWNDDILKDIDNVCLHIIRTVKENQP